MLWHKWYYQCSTAGGDLSWSSSSLTKSKCTQIILDIHLSKNIKVGHDLSSEFAKFTENHEMPCKYIQRILLIAFELVGLPLTTRFANKRGNKPSFKNKADGLWGYNHLLASPNWQFTQGMEMILHTSLDASKRGFWFTQLFKSGLWFTQWRESIINPGTLWEQALVEYWRTFCIHALYFMCYDIRRVSNVCITCQPSMVAGCQRVAQNTCNTARYSCLLPFATSIFLQVVRWQLPAAYF